VTLTDASTGVKGSFDVSIMPTITPPNPTTAVGYTVQLSLTDSYGQPFASNPAWNWSLSDPSIATVDTNGLVTGVSKGLVTITATDPNFPASNVSAVIDIVVQHWAGQYSISSCTAFPVGDAPAGWQQWYIENPCDALGASSSGTDYSGPGVIIPRKGYFYFDDYSPDVTFGEEGPSISHEISRRVFPLGWKSSDSTFTLTVPVAFGPPVINGIYTLWGSGNRKTVFTVTNRSPTSMSGTFSVDTVSISIFGVDVAVPTQGFGTWKADLVTRRRPQTMMNGFDFCGTSQTRQPLPDEVMYGYGSMQMTIEEAIAGRYVYVMPFSNFSNIINGCRFN
jgi:hypothetical protein